MAPVDAAVHRRAGIDVLMNFAKLGPSAPVRDRADDEWHTGMEVYCLDIVRPTRLVTPIMQGWSESAIVFSVAPIAISWRRTGQSSAHVGARWLLYRERVVRRRARPVGDQLLRPFIGAVEPHGDG